MRTHRDQIIVLKSTNYSEADKILVVYGKYSGKFSILAKGIRKIASRNRGNTQTLSIADISYYKAKGLALLLETKSVYTPDYTTVDIKNTQRVLGMVSKMVDEGQGSERTFSALASAIKHNLDTQYTNRFRILFLLEEGLIGDLSSCGMCGSSEEVKYIQLSTLTTVCDECYKKNKWSSKDIMGLGKDIYSSVIFTEALDNYVNNLY
jgi:DNA repair protein RecO (recombination protein O)